MAELTITIGPVTATISESNARANKMLTAYSEAIGASGTSSERARQVLQSLVYHMAEVNRRYRTNQVQMVAAAALQEELNDLYWGAAPESPQVKNAAATR